MRLDERRDCIVCLCRTFFMPMNILQPVIHLKCPHKNKHVKKIHIEISNFWTNIQWALFPIFLIGIAKAIQDYQSSSEGLDSIFSLIILVSMILVTCNFILLTHKSTRLREARSIQDIFDKTSDWSLPRIFNPQEVLLMNKLTTLLIVGNVTILFLSIFFAVTHSNNTLQHAIWFIECVITIVNPNIGIYYIYFYYIMCKTFDSLDDYVISMLRLRAFGCGNDVFLNDAIKKCVDMRMVLKKNALAIINNRGTLFLFATLALGVCGVIGMYFFVKFYEYIFHAFFMFKSIQCSLPFIGLGGLFMIADYLHDKVK